MTITYLDVETTFVVDENRRTDPSPFNAHNKLVSVQYSHDNGPIQFDWFYHKDCLLYTSPSPRDVEEPRMPSSA